LLGEEGKGSSTVTWVVGNLHLGRGKIRELPCAWGSKREKERYPAKGRIPIITTRSKCDGKRFHLGGEDKKTGGRRRGGGEGGEEHRVDRSGKRWSLRERKILKKEKKALVLKFDRGKRGPIQLNLHKEEKSEGEGSPLT